VNISDIKKVESEEAILLGMGRAKNFNNGDYCRSHSKRG
jgi:hypothetical protein